MRRLIASVIVLAAVLVALVPGISEAGKNLNHSQSLLRG
jgi:hypothetical protein